jgi:hypothetical protein
MRAVRTTQVSPRPELSDQNRESGSNDRPALIGLAPVKPTKSD